MTNREELIVVYFKIISRYFLGRTAGQPDNSPSVYRIPIEVHIECKSIRHHWGKYVGHDMCL